ncbi:hypothetical protein [Terrabacter sp. NPDC080008]|uniref:hypothetical protein n=1 Tax=Terrabacter sp. NPDC080008 TaxID=3155176 RepID=UPI0034500393
MVVFIDMDPQTRNRRNPRVAPARPLLTLAVGAVLAAGACGSTPSPVGQPTGAPTATASTGSSSTRTVTVGSVRLEATMGREGKVQGGATVAGMSVRPGLVVEYRLANTGAKPVLAYDVVPQDLGSATLPAGVDVQHTWVYEQSGVLRLSKQGFAPAPNVRFAAAPVIGAHTVAPGKTLTGRAYAVWPLVLDVPGESFSAPRQRVDPSVGTWQFCVQVDGRAAQARPSAVAGVMQVPVAAPQGDQLVCTQPAPIPAP